MEAPKCRTKVLFLDVEDTFKKKSGIYVITPYQRDATLQNLTVKIGSGKYTAENPNSQYSLARRLDSYLLCYPKGFRIYGIFACDRDRLGLAEHSIHQYLKGKGYHTGYPHGHGEEWFDIPIPEIIPVLNLIKQQTFQRSRRTPLCFIWPRGYFWYKNLARRRRVKALMTPLSRRIFEQRMQDTPPKTVTRRQLPAAPRILPRVFARDDRLSTKRVSTVKPVLNQRTQDQLDDDFLRSAGPIPVQRSVPLRSKTRASGMVTPLPTRFQDPPLLRSKTRTVSRKRKRDGWNSNK